MSGGVDSSVAALLLIEQGFEVEGLFMRNWDSAINQDVKGNPDIDLDTCPQETDYLDAERVCDQLGIHLHRHDFVHEYWDHVFATFLRELEAGRTPNPDILCNKHIKFDQFISAAKALGADKIAMGHFARIDNDVPPKLLRGIDFNKDQSYFLCQIAQDDLADIIFPIGHLTKPEVRALAQKRGLQTASKPDSTGICFIGERRFREFLAEYIPMKEGEILTLDGNRVGTHSGVYYYTIGQRKGLGIGGGGNGEPYFVVKKDVLNNILYVSQGECEKLYTSALEVDSFNFIPEPLADGSYSVEARIRHRQPLQKAQAIFTSGRLTLKFEQKQRAVAEGQYAVLYINEYCIGGGVIERTRDASKS